MHVAPAGAGYAGLAVFLPIFVFSLPAGDATWPFFAVLALSGTARAFSGSAVQSFTPFLVPREQFANAVGWSASTG